MTDVLDRAADVARTGEPTRWVPLPAGPDIDRIASRVRARLERSLTGDPEDVATLVRTTVEAGLLASYLAGRRSLGDDSPPTDAQRAAFQATIEPQMEGVERVLAGPLAQAVMRARDGSNLKAARGYSTFARALAVRQADLAIRRVYETARRLAAEREALATEEQRARMRTRWTRQREDAERRLAAQRAAARKRARLVDSRAARALDKATEDERAKVWRGEATPDHLGEVLLAAGAAFAVTQYARSSRAMADDMGNAYGFDPDALLSQTDPSEAPEQVERHAGTDRGRWVRALGLGWLAYRMLKWARRRITDDVVGRGDRTAAVAELGRQHVVAASGVPERVILAYWVLGYAEHCPDCIRLSAMSPYRWGQLLATGIMPGSGHTRCGGRCRCHIELEVPA